MFGGKEIIRETVLGYIFWALFQALAPMIWFYPLNELEISGYEAYVLFLFSPAFIDIACVRRFCEKHHVLSVLRLLSLASVASFQAPTTLQRLVTLSCGCSCVMIVFTVSLWADQENRTLTFWGHILGLFAFLVSRVWFTSFVPLWWNVQTNSVGLAIGAIATLDKIFYGKKIERESSKQNENTKEPGPSWFLTGIGFGSVLFSTQWVFGELSVVSRWTVQGYLDTGPSPYPWGFVVLLALWLGVELSPCHHVTKSAIWWGFGTLGIGALYFLSGWKAFAGGMLFATYLMSVWPEVVDRVTCCPPGRTVTLALFVWLVETLFSVWTVAYNFVPGGVYTREHTDWLIAFVMLSIGAASLNRKPPPNNPSKTAFAQIKNTKMPCSRISKVLFFLILLGAGGYIQRYRKQIFDQPSQTYQRKTGFTAAIWTFHFGYDNQGWPSMERAATLLKNSEADVVTLLESDASKTFLGNNDLGMWLSERLGMYVDFGPSTKHHTWGNLILSKYPIVNSTHHLLPSPKGELAPAITATINITGRLVNFVVTHMGNDRDVLDRELQAKFLAKELKQAKNPVVFLGYITSEPYSRDYKVLTKQGNVNDIDRTDMERWCEYILYRGLIRLGYARISHGGLSDTEVQVAKFRIPDDPVTFHDNSKVVTNAARVDPDVLFSYKFGVLHEGHNWSPTHQYHMGTPKYFIR